jgi:hypothetical protein
VNHFTGFLFSKENSMNKLLLFLIASTFAITVSIEDFKPALGKWKGTITYLDYTSGKSFSMPCNITITNDKTNSRQLILAFEYPQEPKANGKDTLRISADGTMIDGEKIVTKENKNDALQIVTETNGVDGNDNKKALIRHIYSISKKTFIQRKEVRFEGEDKFIMRNEFKMSR